MLENTALSATRVLSFVVAHSRTSVCLRAVPQPSANFLAWSETHWCLRSLSVSQHRHSCLENDRTSRQAEPWLDKSPRGFVHSSFVYFQWYMIASAMRLQRYHFFTVYYAAKRSRHGCLALVFLFVHKRSRHARLRRSHETASTRARAKDPIGARRRAVSPVVAVVLFFFFCVSGGKRPAPVSTTTNTPQTAGRPRKNAAGWAQQSPALPPLPARRGVVLHVKHVPFEPGVFGEIGYFYFGRATTQLERGSQTAL